MRAIECAQEILETLSEDYPVELDGLISGVGDLTMNVSVGSEQVLLRVVEGRILLADHPTGDADIVVMLERGLLFGILDGTRRVEDALGSMDLDIQGDQDVILSLSSLVEDFIAICHRSARIVKALNEFRYGPMGPIS